MIKGVSVWGVASESTDRFTTEMNSVEFRCEAKWLTGGEGLANPASLSNGIRTIAQRAANLPA